jgi:hypothetical protein
MLTLDPSERPSVEQLESIPNVTAAAKDSYSLIREYKFNQAYTTKVRELKAKEAELARREAAVREKEAQLALLEKKLMALPGQAGAAVTGAGAVPTSAFAGMELDAEFGRA